ncbi:MAG: hypothetical protein GX640_02870 [Fibrobacter sp.]|nr:hypothetical protein [Fibrobacter sp.]
MCLNLVVLRENLSDSEALDLQKILQKAGVYSIVSASDFKNPGSLRNLMILREERQLAESALAKKDFQCTP